MVIKLIRPQVERTGRGLICVEGLTNTARNLVMAAVLSYELTPCQGGRPQLRLTVQMFLLMSALCMGPIPEESGTVARRREE
jgi:hypothetical protein